MKKKSKIPDRRSRHGREMFLLLLSGVLLFQWGKIDAFAAAKEIKTVNIRVTSKLEVGSKLPDIKLETTTVSDGEVAVDASGGKYSVSEAEWTDKSSNELKAAEEPQMKVTLEPEDVSEDYFVSSYKKADVKISGGTFVSARRDGDELVVTLRVKGIKGDYAAPEDAWWNEKSLGQAKWEKPDNTSGYYEVQLYRGKTKVYSVSQTSATQYNFYPYMTKTGEYTFKVRTVPGTDSKKKYGGKSEWIESGELSITDRYVSDGKGQQSKNPSAKPGTTDTVGWVKKDNIWNYRFPDGSICRGTWQSVNGYWYYFDVNGTMLTGWQKLANDWYYLYGTGEMATGWAKINGQWYYFWPLTENGHTQGTMAYGGWKIIGADYYFFREDGSLYTGWLEQNGSWYYLNTLDNSLQGAMFTGWLIREGKTYFLDADGVMATGWYQVDGNWYYFWPDSGEMAKNQYINGFYVNEDGIWYR